MKKIYKMTEDQVANLITNRKNSVSETSSPKETKKKYKITEEQLKRIFSASIWRKIFFKIFYFFKCIFCIIVI